MVLGDESLEWGAHEFKIGAEDLLRSMVYDFRERKRECCRGNGTVESFRGDMTKKKVEC